MTAARERTEGIPGGWRCPTLQQYRIPALHTSTSKNRNTVTTTFPLSFFFFVVYILSYVCLVVVCVQWRDSTSPLSVFLVFQESFFSLSLSFFEFILLHLPRDFVSAGFLVMKSLMFTIGIHEDNFF